MTGVRRAESVRRMDRKGFEVKTRLKADKILLNDNADDRRPSEYCMQKNSYICNPIIDWSDKDVWHFIKGFNLPYCKLYDEGFKRLGCIGCPMAPIRERELELNRYPKLKEQYIRTFQRMLDSYPIEKKKNWADGDDVFDWWIFRGENSKFPDGRQTETLFEEVEP